MHDHQPMISDVCIAVNAQVRASEACPRLRSGTGRVSYDPVAEHSRCPIRGLQSRRLAGSKRTCVHSWLPPSPKPFPHNLRLMLAHMFQKRSCHRCVFFIAVPEQAPSGFQRKAFHGDNLQSAGGEFLADANHG